MEENDEKYSDDLIQTPPYNTPNTFRVRESLSGMFRDWYLEYASYVILERAVPHIEDGLKPVQRRILHSMQTLDDGKFNKVANIVGNTMQYHPHGDASIGDALVQLGQKDLLIDCQGNWGNILTGDGAAAPRYIEARLSEFALETIFSPKVTDWTVSYDGRKPEPVTLPAKFPLLLAQGVEGIAVGLSSKILPHNFNEILDACVAYIHGDDFTLLPDFQTGGLLDASRYADGARGGSVRVRAKIEKIDNKTLAITEIPFGKTTGSLIASILSAMEKGKIKIRKVDDNTSSSARIIVHLIPGSSSDKTIDALYAFTDCEVSISPNCCVIRDRKPQFLTVSDVLRDSVDSTMNILFRELEIKLGEALEEQLFCSLEKIFIEERIYKDAEVEEAEDMDAALDHIDRRLEPWRKSFFREPTRDDLLHLWEIRMKRILKFNAKKADEKIAALDETISRLRYDMEHIREYTEKWYLHLKEKYGARYPRRTVIRGFDSIEAAKVAEANKRLYYDKAGGFIGTGLKDAEFKFTCSDIDDILVIYKDGTYRMIKVQDKVYVGKNVIHISLYKRSDTRTVYNAVYRYGKKGGNDPKAGYTYKKRFPITGLTRDKEYKITRGLLPESEILYLSANPNGEAEVVTVKLKEPKDEMGLFKSSRRKSLKDVIVNFADLGISKGRDSLGNLVTKYDVRKVEFSEALGSTLGAREVWFDFDVLRLNYEGRGTSLGFFQGKDLILVLDKSGNFYTTSYSDTNHYDDDILRILKFEPGKVWTVVLFDPSLGFHYIKRFSFEPSARKQQYLPDGATIVLMTDSDNPKLLVTFGGNDRHRAPIEINAKEFIGEKSFRAKGKRLSNYQIEKVEEILPEAPEETVPDAPEGIIPDITEL